jgi:hypothetical protein
VFAGLEVDPRFEARFRAATPELPEDPTDEQVDAWVELAELVSDPDFRDRIRRMTERTWGGSAAGPAADAAGPAAAIEFVAERGTPALAAGVDPAGQEAAGVLDEVMDGIAGIAGREDGPACRREVLTRWEAGTDARAERYWQLLAVVNGWPPIPSRVPAVEWVTAALRARLTPA